MRVLHLSSKDLDISHKHNFLYSSSLAFLFLFLLVHFPSSDLPPRIRVNCHALSQLFCHIYIHYRQHYLLTILSVEVVIGILISGVAAFSDVFSNMCIYLRSRFCNFNIWMVRFPTLLAHYSVLPPFSLVVYPSVIKYISISAYLTLSVL